TVLLSGFCGECSDDDDCDGGCSPPSPLSAPPEGSRCNTGMLGDGCQTSEVCSDGLSCAEIINAPGLLTLLTCSECDTSADCGPARVCNVSVDLLNFSGERTCVEPQSVADGEFCDLEGDGNEACDNFCAEASVKGLLTFGVCGECRFVGGTVEGCMDGQTCVEAEVDIGGAAFSSFCE
ncbi:MAG: hypothetical protein KUG77_14545, partial [Nannocystaceae bacterium]|nr:hypothetical protein [Nannocystaceae bacterium]